MHDIYISTEFIKIILTPDNGDKMLILTPAICC